MKYYCRVSHSIKDQVVEIGVKIQREPFKRPNAMDIEVTANRSEQACMKALRESLILEDPARGSPTVKRRKQPRRVLDPARPPDSFTTEQVKQAIRGAS